MLLSLTFQNLEPVPYREISQLHLHNVLSFDQLRRIHTTFQSHLPKGPRGQENQLSKAKYQLSNPLQPLHHDVQLDILFYNQK